MKEYRKILRLNNIAKVGTDGFRTGYTFTEDINEAHGVLVRSAVMHDTEFPDCLRAIARAGAGVNNIPLEKCAQKGIVVFNTPGANANAVKELVIAGLMYSSRDIIGAVEWVKAHADDAEIAASAEKAKKQFAGCEVMGKKLGVIGLGAIGVLVANVAVELGMEVYGYDPYISVGSAWKLNEKVMHITDVGEIYANCDYITLHVPSMPSTNGMINAEAIEKMKPGVRILNYARDLLVDEEAISKALESGKVACYAVDFPNPRTANMKNTIVTPHIAASTEEAEDNCAIMAVRELQDYLDNGNITHSVNYPDLDAGVCKTISRIACLHRNVPGMLGQLTAILSEANANIANLYNKSRGGWAYSLIDLDSVLPEEYVAKLKGIDGMCRVRIVK